MNNNVRYIYFFEIYSFASAISTAAWAWASTSNAMGTQILQPFLDTSCVFGGAIEVLRIKFEGIKMYSKLCDDV